MILVDRDVLLDGLNNMNWRVTGIGQKMAEKQVRDMIDNSRTIDAIPITFINEVMDDLEERIANCHRYNYFQLDYLCARHNALRYLIRRWNSKNMGEEE